MMNSAMIEGLQIIAVVTAMTVVVCPALLWVLPDRIHHTNGTSAA
ncbi:hypothetical protein [Pseudanabaena sp. FACHB-2040]|nr:hypothetical protein [Pseudanabaena sp. FACHB-2040]